MLTAAQSVAYEYVTDAATQACMRRYGQDYPLSALPGPDSIAVQSRSVLYRRYGITDERSARTWGYHLPHDPRPTGKASSTALKGPPPAARRVLLGRETDGSAADTAAGRHIPPGGCLAEARHAVNGDIPLALRPGHAASGIVAQLKAASFHTSQTDPRVIKAVTAWTACMKRHNYQVSSPLEAGGDLLSLRAPYPDKAEIAMAQADIACKNATGLAETWLRVESEDQNAAITAHTAELNQARKARDIQVTNIQRLLRTYQTADSAPQQ